MEDNSEDHQKFRGTKNCEEKGMGLLKVSSPNFLAVQKECSDEIKKLQSKYKNTMKVMIKAL